MIYGLNFNETSIPLGVKAKFAARVRISRRIMQTNPKTGRNEVIYPAIFAYLHGVGQSKMERDVMLLQADNGRRKLHVEERKTANGIWYGIYAY